ncbi:hypothetical protein QSJ19_08680 [Gordonia sp. ABSL11-1]|jgi:hypothetical protein|uniref:three-helix bundle dimerization domain-containing protein n=1 Tax=Gordonia sp. ABSL11-1 TaxID=3053924 RepID=UPI002573948B|nr:hypothetical protein [Gordonia sp. ABSL11-1]MDL9945659.1 hypothetical protein [Gordonia sp. ABSL11-1]
MTGKTEQQHIDEVRDRLAARFPDQPTDAVAAAVDTVYRELGDTRVRDFIPLLVERRAGAELAALAH